MSYPPQQYSPSLDENEASSSTAFQQGPPSLGYHHSLPLNPLLLHQQQPQFWSPSHLAAGPSGFFQPQQGGWGFSGGGGGAFGGGGPGQGGGGGMGGGDELAGMELSQGEMDQFEEMASVPCTFFFSPQGCLNGDQCRFSHDENPQQHQEEEEEEDNEEYGPPPPELAAGPSRKRDRTVSATESEEGRHEKEAKLEDKAALLRRRLQEAKAARLSKPSSSSTPKPTSSTSSSPAPAPAPASTPSLPPHLLNQLSTLLSTLTTTHSLLSLPAKPLPPPNPFQISPLTEEILTTRLELDHERGRVHRWGVVVEKGERVREELDERRRRREEEEAERVAFLRTTADNVGKADEDLDLDLNPLSRDDDSTAGEVEEEDLRCALRVLGVLARGERELANQTQSQSQAHLSLNTNPSSNLPPINYTSLSSSSYSQGRSTYTSSLTPPTKFSWTPQEHAMLRRMEADLHNPPRMSGALGGSGGLGGMGGVSGGMGGALSLGGGGGLGGGGAMGMGGKGAGGGVVLEEPKLALPSRAEGGGW